jgi:glycosyltransferase involved in cell wall biosynthesis
MPSPTISYVIAAHGEDELFNLIPYIKQHKDKEDKIIVLNNPTTSEYEAKIRRMEVKLVNQPIVNNDYSAYRNSVMDKLTTDYIAWIDCDEVFHPEVHKNIKSVLVSQNYPDVVILPRLNRVIGIKPIQALYLNFTLHGEIVSWPDPQTRIIKVKSKIKWVEPCHEHLDINKFKHSIVQLDNDIPYAIIHTKTIEKQLATHKENQLRYADSVYYKGTQLYEG